MGWSLWMIAKSVGVSIASGGWFSSNSLADLFPLILTSVSIVNLFHRTVTCADWWNPERIDRGYRW